MREIEFRAWDIERKKYHYPKLWDNSMPINWQRHYKLYQYTGLKDKNGTKIFEGDITFHHAHNKKCKIVWIDKFMCFAGETIDEVVKEEYNFYQSIDCKNLEVIGNIHDNPELLNID